MAYLGIDVGGTKIAVGFLKRPGELSERFEYPTDLSLCAVALMDDLVGRIRERQREPVLGVGVALPSSVDFARGYVKSTTNIPLLKNFSIRKALGQAFSCPVLADNDANAAALAEFRYGAGRGAKNMLYSTASTGIGGGLVLEGQVFRGDHDCAGEIGHMIVTPNEGVTCGCGNKGCFESYCGGANLHKHVALRLSRGETTSMANTQEEAARVDGKRLSKAFFEGDEMARAMVDQLGFYLGLLYYNLFLTLNIDRIVVGGGLTHLGEALFLRVRDSFLKFAGARGKSVLIVPAALGADFGIIGAAQLLFETINEQE